MSHMRSFDSNSSAAGWSLAVKTSETLPSDELKMLERRPCDLISLNVKCYLPT